MVWGRHFANLQQASHAFQSQGSGLPVRPGGEVGMWVGVLLGSPWAPQEPSKEQIGPRAIPMACAGWRLGRRMKVPVSSWPLFSLGKDKLKVPESAKDPLFISAPFPGALRAERSHTPEEADGVVPGLSSQGPWVSLLSLPQFIFYDFVHDRGSGTITVVTAPSPAI